jgi:hypothetical protein
MSYDITEALQKMEEELIQSMKRNLQRHLDEEDDEGFDWAQWQAEKLNSIARYRAQNRKIIGDYTSTIPQQIDDMIRKSYETGKQQEEIRILKAIRQGYLAASAPAGEISTGFFTVNERKLNALVKATQGEMHKGISSILRYQDDIYRKTIFRSAAQFNMGGKSLGQAVDAATKDFLAQGIQNIRYKDGRCVNIASYAEMALRTANLRANIQGEAAKRDAWGICTVKLSAHGSACPKCIPWQGKVYYDDVYSSIPVPKDGKYPLLSTAIEGGALHPNCKNGVHTWFEGINEPPREMTQEEIDEANRRYDLEQQQRYCERNVRKYKRMKLGAIDPENAAKYAAQEQAWRKRLNSLVKENKDVLRMDYRRLKVYDAPAPPAGKTAAVPPTPKPKAAKAKVHTEGASSGHAVEVTPPATKDNGGIGKTYSPEKIGGKSLTSGVDGGIIKMGKAKKQVIAQAPADFSKYTISEDVESVQVAKNSLISSFGLEEKNISLDGICNAEVLKPFADQLIRIHEQTGFKLPNIHAVEMIDGDPCCIAGYKPMENRFYISSRYFNSKEALLDTLKSWASIGILPKQGKSIRYLAEHESAHMRIPDKLLQSEEAQEIQKTFLHSKSYNDNDAKIEEFFADAIAIYRMNPLTTDACIVMAVEYLKKAGIT